MALRHRIIQLGFDVLTATGAARALRPLARGRGIIFTLHRVRPARPSGFQPNALLEIEPAFLDRVLHRLAEEGFKVVSLAEAAAILREDRPGPPFAVLTFDDGYRDNVDHAQPVLERHGAPWTMFVTTGFADATARLWWLELEEAVRLLPRIELDLPQAQLSLSAQTDDEKRAAFDAAYAALRALPEPAMREAIAALAARAGIDPLAFARDHCLRWDELRALAARPGVSIGAHTLTHPMLAKHDDAFVRAELRDGRSRIEAELGRPVTHLAYPVGDPTSAGAREFALAAEAGYEVAVTTRPGHVFAGHARHLLALPRVSLNGLFQTDAALTAMLDGLPFLIWNRGRRLDVA